jgi:hypothetical protein
MPPPRGTRPRPSRRSGRRTRRRAPPIRNARRRRPMIRTGASISGRRPASTATRRATSASDGQIGANAYTLSGQGLVSKIAARQGRCSRRSGPGLRRRFGPLLAWRPPSADPMPPPGRQGRSCALTSPRPDPETQGRDQLEDRACQCARGLGIRTSAGLRTRTSLALLLRTERWVGVVVDTGTGESAGGAADVDGEAGLGRQRAAHTADLLLGRHPLGQLSSSITGW